MKSKKLLIITLLILLSNISLAQSSSYKIVVDEIRTIYVDSLGQLHREDGPAVIEKNGHKEWYKNGKRHREDGPAREWSNGQKEWYINGKEHREDGPAIIHTNGLKVWFKNGEFHREDGPAVILQNGQLQWWLNGKWYETKENWLIAVHILKLQKNKN